MGRKVGCLGKFMFKKNTISWYVIIGFFTTTKSCGWFALLSPHKQLRPPEKVGLGPAVWCPPAPRSHTKQANTGTFIWKNIVVSTHLLQLQLDLIKSISWDRPFWSCRETPRKHMAGSEPTGPTDPITHWQRKEARRYKYSLSESAVLSLLQSNSLKSLNH